jgi:hypothetical protein
MEVRELDEQDRRLAAIQLTLNEIPYKTLFAERPFSVRGARARRAPAHERSGSGRLRWRRSLSTPILRSMSFGEFDVQEETRLLLGTIFTVLRERALARRDDRRRS